MPLCVGVPLQSSYETERKGLHNNHAYTLIDVRGITTAHGDQLRLVKLRNPHARHEWNGSFSDKDKRSWSSELKNMLGWEKKNDGLFWMKFEDFETYFRSVYVNRHQPGWHYNSVASTWDSGSQSQSQAFELTVILPTPLWQFTCTTQVPRDMVHPRLKAGCAGHSRVHVPKVEHLVVLQIQNNFCVAGGNPDANLSRCIANR